MDLTKKLRDLTDEEKVDVIEAIYIEWLKIDCRPAFYRLIFNISRDSAGVAQLTTEEKHLVDREFVKICLYYGYQNPNMMTVEDLINTAAKEE